MINIEFTAEGFYAAALNSAKYMKAVKKGTRAAQKQSLKEYLTGKNPGLQDRFDQSQMGRLGLQRRSPGYEARQLKMFGRIIPYRSPRRTGKHMQDTLRRQGSGWKVSARNTKAPEVRTRFTLPGARVLNLLARDGKTKRYKDRFLRLRHSTNRADANRIQGRANDLTGDAIIKAMEKTKKTSLRNAKRVKRLL